MLPVDGLETKLLKTVGSGVQLVQLAVDDFLVVDKLVIHIGIVVLPLFHGRYLGFKVARFLKIY